jgi:glycosidase
VKGKKLFTLGILSLLTTVLAACGGTQTITDIIYEEIAETPMYEISFYSNGGTAVPSIIEPAGTTITRPGDPVKEAATFVNWYTDFGTWLHPYEFTVMPEAHVALYAKWEEMTSDEIDAYRNEMAAMSQPNHLYLHYRRFDDSLADYKNWDVWIWPFSGTGRITSWMTDPDNPSEIYHDPFGGVIMDLDLSVVYHDGGHDNAGHSQTEEVDFMPEGTVVDSIGFLITYTESRTAGDVWKSDGGDQFINTAEALAVGPNGSMHVYCVQDNVFSKSYQYGGEVFENPYENDDGTNVSSRYNDVDSSGAKMPIVGSSKSHLDDAIGYEIMVSSFADSDDDGFGDIKGVYDNLDYIKSLNVDVLWLTPVNSSDSYHGYDIYNYYQIDTRYGSSTSPFAVDGVVTNYSALMDYLLLLNECRNRGIKVIMDLVVNHSSISNLMFQESLTLDPEYRAYYQWKNVADVTTPTGMVDSWYQYSTYDYAYYAKFSPSMPELNYDYQATRDAIVDVTHYWCDLGVTGFRIDAVKHVYMEEETTNLPTDMMVGDIGSGVNYSSNLTKNLHFFRELNFRLKEAYPEAFIVGENFDGHAYHVAPYYEGLDSMLDFYMYFNITNSIVSGAVHGADSGNPWNTPSIKTGATIIPNNTYPSATGNPGDVNLGDLYGGDWNIDGVLDVYDRYKSDDGKLDTKAVPAPFTSNHDLSRPINRVVGTLDATGDISAPGVVNTSNAALATTKSMLANIATLTLPGTSFIYYGDELGMSSNGWGAAESHADRWSRQPFKWDKTGTSKYTTGFSFTAEITKTVEWDDYNKTIDGVAEQAAVATSPLSSVRRLTDLIAQSDALRTGDYTPVMGADGQVFAFRRASATETIEVYINMSNVAHTVNLNGVSLYAYNGATVTNLPAWSAIVVGL